MGCPSSDEDEPEDGIKVVKSPDVSENTGKLKSLATEPAFTQNTECNRQPVVCQESKNGNLPPIVTTSTNDRRSSLPPGLLENGQINSLCGQILRYMGDEQYSMACGRHLRCMGDQLCYNYFLRNVLRRSGEFQHTNTYTLRGSHSSPNLTKQ